MLLDDRCTPLIASTTVCHVSGQLGSAPPPCLQPPLQGVSDTHHPPPAPNYTPVTHSGHAHHSMLTIPCSPFHAHHSMLTIPCVLTCCPWPRPLKGRDLRGARDRASAARVRSTLHADRGCAVPPPSLQCVRRETGRPRLLLCCHRRRLHCLHCLHCRAFGRHGPNAAKVVPG